MKHFANWAALLLTAIFMSGCANVIQPAEPIGPNNPAALAAIRAAYIKAGEQKYFRARMTSESAGKISESTVEFAAPASMHMVMKTDNVEQIVINGTHYLKTDGKWMRLPISSGNLIEQMRKDPAAIAAFEKTISGAQIIGPEPVNNKPAMAYRYYQAATVGGGLASSAGWVKFWVGANGLPLKLESDTVGRVLGFSSQSKSTIYYTDYGVSVRVVAPI